jgi:AcrR family transcriptional regulator
MVEPRVEPRRRRASSEAKRLRLLDAAEELMLTDGYAAVTSRALAAKVGIPPGLVHYYFATLDDLFVELLRRRATPTITRMEDALSAPEPLRAWWEIASDPRGTRLFTELLAAANHRPPLKVELGEMAKRVRAAQVEALRRLLPEYGLDGFAPALIASTVQGLAFSTVSDAVAGFDTDHDIAIEATRALIDELEQRRRGYLGLQ